MDKSFVTRLLVPLLGLFMASVGLHIWLNWDGFFLNLATEIIGILTTVAYVDHVLRRYESKRWHKVEAKVKFRLQVFVIETIAACRVSFRYGLDIFDRTKLDSTDIGMVRAEMVRVAREILEPMAPSRIESLDVEGWRMLDMHIRSIWDSTEKMLLIFGDKLAPTQYALILDIQDEIKAIQLQYLPFPDIVGVSDDQLPTSSKIPSTTIKESINNMTAQHLKDMLRMLRELDATLERHDG